MKRAALAGILSICIFLTGCSDGLDGKHIWTQVHSIPVSPGSNQNISAQNYDQLYRALVNLVENGTTQATISVAKYDKERLDADALEAIEAVRRENPIAAYAVEQIHYTLGTSGGEDVLAVEIGYLHDQTEIKKIKTVADNAAAAEAIAESLKNCEAGIVLKILNFEPADFTQMVEDHAMLYPEQVMEQPQVTENIYPETGKTRVVELKFVYQTSRETLKSMQARVEDLFESAQLFVRGYRSEERRFARFYTWLTEINEYTIQTSITPAYSLLQYGTGDSRAFATVYTALCRQLNLECMTVSGTKDGESRYWNLIRIDDVYYHLDLLQCSEEGSFRRCTDSQMEGYVWDYDAYPASPDPEPEPTQPETTAPTAPEATEPTVPQE